MLRLKNVSTGVFMVTAMLPACSLIIDTKADGVLDATAGKGSTKADSSRTVQTGAVSSSAATRLSSGGTSASQATTAGGAIASSAVQNGGGNAGGDTRTAVGVGAAPADTTPISSSGGTAPIGVGGASAGDDGGTGGLAASGGGVNTTGQNPVETCSGCLIGSTCVVAGTENAQNVCETCDPSRNAKGWSPSDGKVCDDENYCSTQSNCEGGECVPSQQRNCGSNQRCDESSDACVCEGCQVGTNCVAAGTEDPSTPCRICSPTASRSAYSPNTGANCGSGPTECSGQDTCSASGTCQPNHSPNDGPCIGGTCQAGACQIEPFDCVVPSPPAVVLPSSVVSVVGSAPAAAGGKVQDGRYVPTRIEIYGGDPYTIEVRTFEFRASYVQVGQRPFMPATGGAVIPEIQFAGSFTTSGSTLSFALERCAPQYNIDVPTLSYTASTNGIVVYETLSGGVTVRTVLARQ